MDIKKLLPQAKSWLISSVVLVIVFLAVRFLFPEEAGNLIDPTNTSSLVVVSFVLALMLKVNYASKLFLFDLIIGIFLASLFTFTQGLLTVILLLIVHKILKFL